MLTVRCSKSVFKSHTKHAECTNLGGTTFLVEPVASGARAVAGMKQLLLDSGVGFFLL